MPNILADALKFGKPLPGCLNTMKMNSDKLSIHNKTGVTSTISVTLYKALRAYAKAQEGSENIGVGVTQDKSYIAEICHSDSDTSKETCICIVKPSGAVYAGVHDGTVMSRFTIGRNNRGGTVLFLALMKKIMADQEAEDTFGKIRPYLLLNPEIESLSMYGEEFQENLAMLCDNIYQRCIVKGTSADITLGSIPTSGKLKEVSEMQLASEKMKPIETIGTFHLFKGSKKNNTSRSAYSSATFKGAYQIDTARVLTSEEEQMVPVLNEDWVIPEEAEKICKHIKNTSGMPEPSRTFYLEGLAGSGKTTIASIVAAGLNLPKVVYTCHAGTEIFDFIGQVMPTGSSNKRDFHSIVKDNGYPSIEDIHYDLEGSYKALTGEKLPLGMDEYGCISILIDKVMKDSDKTAFMYVESDFIKAIKYGWVCEIQEPASVLQQGVLVGLNSLLEPNGVITLPTGEMIRRHPDTVIIFTANPSNYKGCDTLNQSIISRANMKLRIESSDVDAMARKAMAVTGFKDFNTARNMADIVFRISRYLIENEIDDGVCGQRELKDWLQAAIVEGEDSYYSTAIDTVIGKATEDLEEKEAIIDGFLKPSCFA